MNIIIDNSNGHVSLDAVKEFETAILNHGYGKPKYRNRRILDFFLKILRIIKLDGIYLKIMRYFTKNTSDNFAILMGPHFSKCVPAMLSKGNNGLYIFDAWPSTHPYLINILSSLKIKYVYFSSKQISDMLMPKLKGIDVRWIPEAINSDEYSFIDYDKKSIDVLQMGRKYEQYHHQIAPVLEENGYKYIYERIKGEIIFEERKDFITAMANSKISICVPSSITHNDRAGGVSSVTLRYWQSMLSKCLIVGKAPTEMTFLFDYNPIIEIDEDDPVKQILEIIENFEKYIPLIERNYLYVMKNHTWEKRLTKMEHLL